MSDDHGTDEPMQGALTLDASASAARNGPHARLEPAADEIHLMDLAMVVYKRRWVAATIFIVVFLTMVVHAFVATPIFEAQARLLIDSDDPNVVTFQAVIEEGKPTADYYQTQYGILRSRGLARRTLDALNLWRSPYLGGTVEAAPSDADRSRTGADEASHQSPVIDTFLANLTIEPVRNSHLVDIKFRSPNAELAARVANDLAKNYIEQTLEYKFTASQEATNWLAVRLAEQRRQVEVAEAALQRYRENNGTVPLENRENIVVQKLSDLNEAVTRANSERMQKEALERELRLVARDPTQLDTFPAILSNAFIQRQKAELADLQQQRAKLADNLGSRHPQMLELGGAIRNSQLKLQAEIDKVVQSVHSEYRAALAHEQSLVAALERQKTEALSMNRRGIDHSVLVRDVEGAKQIYETLLQRARETGVTGELRTSNIRIVDVAEQPRSPASPQLRVNLMLGILGGLILALAVAFLFEYLDSRLKSPEEVRTCLGLPSLGMLPELTQPSSTAPLMGRGAGSEFSEALRAIRLNILFSITQKGHPILAVTSTAPSEGKTTVACNLAIAFALARHRVLLVDADMRRSGVHKLFDLAQEPGLSNVLVGDVTASEALRKTDVEGLWTLPAGRTPPNPAELLGSKAFEDLLRSLDGQFDTIVIDTPPVTVVADPSSVASIASGVVFVVGADMTNRQAARTAIEQLERGNARILGAVLNRVQLDKHAYYYSRYYQPGYSAYYSVAPS